jgi:glycosyltransferase involved in cell wall biosynthesis
VGQAPWPTPTEIVIINDFSTAQGGATVIALLEARELRQRGHKVTWISGDGPSPELESIGVQQLALGSAPLLGQSVWRAMSDGLHNFGAAWAIANWIKRNDRPDTVYHLHNWSQILSPAVFDALRRVEERLVVTCHDFFNLCPNGGLTHFRDSAPCNLSPLSASCLVSQCDRRSPAQKYWRTLRHLRLNHAARFSDSAATFTFLHERMQERFVERGFSAPDLVTLRNPVDPWTQTRIEAENNQGFLFVGRIGPDKGADLAIAAASAARQQLTMVGGGEEEIPGSRGNPDVRFAGWLKPREVAQLAQTARALIVPSRVVEPFGLVVLEAAMSGLPVILSSHAFLAAESAELGFAKPFDVCNAHGLSEVLGVLASDDELVRSMSVAGFERAGTLCHTPASWIDELMRIFSGKLVQANEREHG